MIAMKEIFNELMFNVIQSVICGNHLSENTKEGLRNSDTASAIITIAKRHDIAHMVAYGLLNNKLVDDIDNQIHFLIYRKIHRHETLNYELTRIVDVLEKNKIPFIPLKGSVIREHYPEPWMRNSCDIDVLVHTENLEVAISCLVKNLQYIEGERTTHDVSLFSPQKVHVELHFDLVEEGRAKSAIEVLEHVWDNVSAHQGYKYWHDMTDEYFYFYHIAHMAKHFETGGCGIRPFIDLWILDHMNNVDRVARDALLSQGNLLKFTTVARELSEVWFGGREANEIKLQMQNFILHGGVYGSTDNRVAIQQKKKGGRFGYVLSRVFVPYAKLKRYYPVLEKHRWLMPIMQIRRWFMLLKPDVARMAKKEMAVNKRIERSEANVMNDFLENIGLN